MGDYLHLFETKNEFKSVYNGEGYEEPWVSYTLENNKVKYNKNPLEDYLTFEILSGGTLYWKASEATSLLSKTIEYSKDDGETWTSISSSTGGTPISVSTGDIVLFRGDNERYGQTDSIYSNYTNSFSASTDVRFNLKGNIMSLLDSKNFSTLKTFFSANTFSQLFSGCVGLIDASKLLLPATELSASCYSTMFYGCSNLIAAPKLPATTIAPGCYWRLFYGCTSLTTAPELPATTLASTCYWLMFYNCTNLNYVKAMFTTTPDTFYKDTDDWLYGVAETGTFVKNPDATWTTTGPDGIPNGWTIQYAN